MAHDSRAHQEVVVGGRTGSGEANDTWVYDFANNTWTDMRPASRPSVAAGPSIVYDWRADRMILFTSDRSEAYVEIWAYDLANNTWANMTPASNPPYRTHSSIVYDARLDRIILFGGGNGITDYGDTWAFDYSSAKWTELKPTTSPPPRQDHTMVYDLEAERVVLFGGLLLRGASTEYYDDTWVFDASSIVWANVTNVIHPSARSGASMVYDSITGLTRLEGGGEILGPVWNDTWTYSVRTNEWANLNPVSSPPALGGSGFAFDSFVAKMVIFGGTDTMSLYSQTWAYDSGKNAWTREDPRNLLPPVAEHATAFDARANRLILYSWESVSNYAIPATFAYDFSNNSWTKMNPPQSPKAIMGAAMVYDPRADRAILFGGGNVYDSETWAYDFSKDTWTNLMPPNGPIEVTWPSMAYDDRAGRSLVFGGIDQYSTIHNETWVYDSSNNRWTSMNPPIAPPARMQSALAYDSRADRFVLFGGWPNFNDTWVYDLENNTWNEVTGEIGPPGLASPSMTYDPFADRAILFGGVGIAANGSYFFNDKPWIFDVMAGTWTQAHSSITPPGRDFSTFVFDTQSKWSLLVGGVVGVTNLNDVWYFASPRATPLAPRGLQALAVDAGIALRWAPPRCSGSVPVGSYRIYRGISPGSESFLVEVASVIGHLDRSVRSGEVYYYRIAGVNGGGEGQWSNEVVVTSISTVDSTAPSITILSPANNTVVSSTTVTVTGTASDNVAVQLVELSTDGTTWTAASGTTTWSGSVALQAGTNLIYGRATDTSGNRATVQITVTVQKAGPGPSGLDPLILATILVAGTVGVTVALIAWKRRKAGRRPPEGSP